MTEPDGGLPIVAAAADGRLGPPVMIRRDAFALADDVFGDQGLRTILAERPELVKRVDVGAHAPDVDTPEDLERLGERCPGCHELYLPVEAPAGRHPYIGASSACWQAFSEVIAREFGDIAYGVVHRHTVDTSTPFSIRATTRGASGSRSRSISSGSATGSSTGSPRLS